jgi:hypothetical protein
LPPAAFLPCSSFSSSAILARSCTGSSWLLDAIDELLAECASAFKGTGDAAPAVAAAVEAASRLLSPFGSGAFFRGSEGGRSGVSAAASGAAPAADRFSPPSSSESSSAALPPVPTE